MAANAAANLLEKSMNALPVKTEASSNYEGEKFADPSGEKQRALIWHGKNDLRMADIPKPRLVDSHDAILKVTGTTVCGSDMHLKHGTIIELQSGDCLGHEFMGEVIEVGSDVKKVKVGDRCVASFNVACSTCWMCRQGLSSGCQGMNESHVMNAMYGNRTAGFFGYSHFAGGFAGGQAEFVRVPFSDFNLLQIPESVPDEKALYLSDILVTSYHQVVDSGVKEGSIVGIWGLGAIGIAVAKWCLLKGASRIIAIDYDQQRLDSLVEKLGSDKIDLINAKQISDPSKEINEKLTAAGTHGLDPTRPPGVDIALECAGGEYAKGWGHAIEMAVGLETDSSEILNEMIKSVRNFGTIGITGVYAAYTNHFNIGSIMQKGVRLIGNGQAPVSKYWKEILDDYLVPGKIDPLKLFVTHRIDLEQTPQIYDAMDSHSHGMIKTFIQTRFSNPPSAGAPQLTKL